jgi:hypothetical protein
MGVGLSDIQYVLEKIVNVNEVKSMAQEDI